MARTTLFECDKCDNTVTSPSLPDGWAELEVESTQLLNRRQARDGDDEDDDEPVTCLMVLCSNCTAQLLDKLLRSRR
jgi:hypothetical protein